MAIIFGGDAGIQESSFSGFIGEIMGSFNHIKDTITNAIEGKGPPPPPKENVHVDTGFANVPGTSFKDSNIDNVDDIKQRRITSQEPSMTIYIKKRAFWGLSDQNDSRFMDSGEKLFMRSSKILFEKKCGQIASYEALTKLSSLVSEDAHLDAAQIELVRELIIEAIQAINGEATGLINKAIDEGNNSFADELRVAAADLREEGHDLAEALRELSTKSHKLRQATNTSWVIDPDQKDVFGVGRGSGVIELTLVSSANTSLDIEGSDGSFNFTVQDPYNLTKITSDDIEISLSSAIAEKARLEYATADEKNYELLGASTLLDRAKRKEEELRRIRQNRIADAFGFDRQALGGGGVAEIVFEINSTSSAANPVVAYTTSTDVPPFNKDSFRIAMLQLPAEEMLTFKEDALVGQIFDLLEDYVHAVKNLNVSVKEGDDAPDTKYARRMLRMHYLGKAIAQPMDSVHIYMRGNTVKHNELIGPLSSILNGTSFFSNVDDNQDVSDAILNAEMKEFGLTDLKIPLDFYKSIRTGSFMRNAGMHVFGGVISSVSESYNASSGSYTLEVSGESNLKWLNLSRVNTQPSLDQPKGMLEDPLTPLELETEPGTGLLKKNPGYLQANKDRINKWGLFNRDEKVNEEDDLKKYDSVSIGDKSQVIMKHAPGLVYKWKQGVIVASLNVNLATSLSGKGDDINNVKRFMGLNVVDQPFAGQDAADIVSLLVTGFPHSADRFINNSKESGTYSSPGSNSSGSFFHSFFDITRSTNKALGNFKPFKHIETGLALHARRIRLQESLKGGYSKIDDLRSQIAVMEDQLLLIEKEDNTTSGEPSNIEKGRLLASTGIADALKELRKELRAEVGELEKRAKQAETDNLIGPGTADGIAFRLDEIPGGIENDAQEENMESIMLKNKLLQLRPQYDCKFNTDSNMFIVSDKYDNDNDIQAFVTNLKKSQNLFQSEYQNPVEICREVTKTIDFEFYCDTQGHIRFRPPQYNRVPLSLVLKMFLLKKGGTQIYPDFLVSLFESRLGTVNEEVENLEDQIGINAMLLNLQMTGPEIIQQVTDNITEEDVTGNLFFKVGGSSKINESDTLFAAEAIVEIRNRIKGSTGRQSYLSNIDNAIEQVIAHNDPKQPQINSIRLNTFNNLKALVARYQQVVSLQKKLEVQSGAYEVSKKDFSKENISKLLAPFSDLIEDDFNDFLGPGSSKRFIIYDDQIISYNFTESDQNAVCRVDVNGELDLLGEGPGNLGGMPAIWAGATDFDMWRMYGYRSNGAFRKPFLTKAEEQCAPYALFLIARARRDIVKANLTVYGNEYYQVGDVVYINSRDMLYYVWGVKQNFSYEGGQFTTSLDLRYGHALGEYIPTPLDVIGKSIIRTQEKFNRIVVTRETANPYEGVHLGMVIFEEEKTEDDFKAMLTEPHARFNVDQLKRSLLIARAYIEENKLESFPKVEVRGWYFEKEGEDKGEVKAKMQKRIDHVIAWLKHPRGRWIENEDRPIKLAQQFDDSKLQEYEITNIIKDANITPVNLAVVLEGDDKKRNRTPNDQVYNATPDGDPNNIIELVLIMEE